MNLVFDKSTIVKKYKNELRYSINQYEIYKN
jgi:hypothetical protein